MKFRMEQALASVMKNIGDALRLDDDSHDKEAYQKYLDCILCIVSNLLQAVREKGGEVVVTKEISKQVKLAQQCVDRVATLIERMGSNQRPTAMVLPFGNRQAPTKLKPFMSVPPLPPEPTANTFARPKGKSPMEVAYHQNQLLMAAYRARLARMNKRDPGAANLSLTLQRKMAENLALAKKQEMALAKKMKERQDRLEEQAAKRFSTPIGMSEEEQEQRQIYKKILEYEQDAKWLQKWRTKLDSNPNEPETICQLIQEILHCRDHPLTLLLKRYQYKVYEKIYPLVCNKKQLLEAITVPLPESLWPPELRNGDGGWYRSFSGDSGADSGFFRSFSGDSENTSVQNKDETVDGSKDCETADEEDKTFCEEKDSEVGHKIGQDDATNEEVRETKDETASSDNIEDSPNAEGLESHQESDGDSSTVSKQNSETTESDKTASENTESSNQNTAGTDSDENNSSTSVIVNSAESTVHNDRGARDVNSSETENGNASESCEAAEKAVKSSPSVEGNHSGDEDPSHSDNNENSSSVSDHHNHSEKNNEESSVTQDDHKTAENTTKPDGLDSSPSHSRSQEMKNVLDGSGDESEDVFGDDRGQNKGQNAAESPRSSGPHTTDPATFTQQTKDDVNEAIAKGAKLQSQLVEEQKKAANILRRFSEDIEKYNAENMDDLFDDDEDDNVDDFGAGGGDSDGHKEEKLSKQDSVSDLPESDQMSSISSVREDGLSSMVSRSSSSGSVQEFPSLPSVDENQEEIQRMSREAYQRHLKNISTDVHQYMEKMLIMFTIAYEQLDSPLGRDQCYASLEETFFKPLWKFLLMLFRVANYKDELAVACKMTQKANASPMEMGISRRLCLIPADGDASGETPVPYQKAIEGLMRIKDHYTMLSKLECTVKVMRYILDCIKDFYISQGHSAADVPSVGADDLLPVVSYVVMKTNLPQLVSECHAMAEFIHEGYIMGQEGYCLTTLETAVSYLVTSDLSKPCSPT